MRARTGPPSWSSRPGRRGHSGVDDPPALLVPVLPLPGDDLIVLGTQLVGVEVLERTRLPDRVDAAADVVQQPVLGTVEHGRPGDDPVVQAGGLVSGQEPAAADLLKPADAVAEVGQD